MAQVMDLRPWMLVSGVDHIMVAVILKEKYCRIPMKKKFVVYDGAVAS